jgi:hypothetical protein
MKLEKIDLKKEFKHLYSAPTKEPVIVDVPEINFLMIDGAGDPNTSQEYQQSIEILFSLSYTLKFAIKKGRAVDYGVMPLEGLWWVDDMSQFSTEKKEFWKWTSMIMQPQFVTGDLLDEALEEVRKKLSGLERVRFGSFYEGLSAQITHIGPFAAEGPTIERLHGFIEESGHHRRGKHHEIYLSDYRRTAPEKLKTIIRQPIAQ